MLDRHAEPWYGTWPPEIKNREVDMEKKDISFWQRWSLFIVGSLLGIIFVLPYHFDVCSTQGWPITLCNLLNTLGFALVTAVIIGGTFNWILVKDLAQDVFKVSIGYLLPEELKPSMQWIYNQHLICTSDVLVFKLTPINKHVKVHVTRTQTIKNKGRDEIKHTPALGIDEWFVGGQPSRITDFTCSLGLDKWPTDEPFNPTRKKFYWDIRSKEFKIPSGGILHIRSEFEEFRQLNDAFLYLYKYPTITTEVTVELFDAIDKEVRFAAIKDPKPKQIGVNTFFLDTVTLPYQYIQIRWWQKTDSEKWMRETNEEET